MLTRFDPFREMTTLRSAVDRLFDSAFGAQSNWPQALALDLAMDVAENDDHFIVKASLPGVNPNEVEITFTDNVLTIKGEIKADQELKESQYHLRERRLGAFSRSLALSSRIKADAIEASFENGVLSLKLPKAEEVKPKRIAIRVGDHKLLEGKAREKK